MEFELQSTYTKMLALEEEAKEAPALRARVGELQVAEIEADAAHAGDKEEALSNLRQEMEVLAGDYE